MQTKPPGAPAFQLKLLRTGCVLVRLKDRRSASIYSCGTAEPNPMSDEALPGTPSTGQTICSRCGGSGLIGRARCPDCVGTGKVARGIGGA